MYIIPQSTFYGTDSFNSDLSLWDVARVTKMPVRLGPCCSQQHPPVHLFAAPWLHGTIVHPVQLLCICV